MKIVLKEYTEEDDDISYNTYEEYIENYEEYDRYIEIDGKKYEINRELDRNTENEIDGICKKILGIEGKASVIKNIAINNLKRKVDPAIVNAIKGIIMANLEEWNEIIDIDYSLNKESWQIRVIHDPDGTKKKVEELQSEIDWAKNAKQKAEEDYKKFLKDYIEAIKEKKKNKLPFAEIVYNCNGKMSISEYNKISSYINAAQTVGGQVIGKRKFFGLIKENISANYAPKSKCERSYNESDTSFVEHVSTNLQDLAKKHKEQNISNNKEKTNSSGFTK